MMSKEVLSLIIESSGRSIKQFADDIGVKYDTVNKWLTGYKKPSPQNQELIRSKFKKQIAKLYK
ncbi:helix-turn-helix domain-containing protein [Chryseobacterium luquanense]|uniref:Helix-turn-helix domain-containing protein n=1 Tax=Chryseobacterium luquanense TaxID=2983766 RepID=A0ABT3Y4S1_9FLAO|nr:helix-turn-helix transcriptional regulator [Chryseobacterium luquanense]MCX8533071.1 helix-turn-helix domain-containing protein [Chryseobacterium luquanense]